MKNYSLLISFFIVVNLALSQYTFTATTGTYVALSSPTSLTNGATWDDPQLTIPLGFNFKLFDSTMNKIFIEDVGLGAFLTSSTSETGILPFLIPYFVDIIDRGYNISIGDEVSGGLSPISYKVTGTSGSQIAKIEWRNAGFYDDIDNNGVSVDSINFQLWLYEGSDMIEIHFGKSSVTQPSLCYAGETGPTVVLSPSVDMILEDFGANTMNLKGNVSNPSVAIINTANSLNYLNGTIPNGTIYRFSQLPSGINETSNTIDFNIFPNPALNYIQITSDYEISQIVIMDVNGKELFTQFSDLDKINIHALYSGIYIVKVYSKKGIAVKKFIKN